MGGALGVPYWRPAMCWGWWLEDPKARAGYKGFCPRSEVEARRGPGRILGTAGWEGQ